MGLRTRLKKRIKNVLRRVVDTAVKRDEEKANTGVEPFVSQKPKAPSPPSDDTQPERTSPQHVPVSPNISDDSPELSPSDRVVPSSPAVPNSVSSPPVSSSEQQDPQPQTISPEGDDGQSSQSPSTEPPVLSEEEKKAMAAAKHWKKVKSGLIKKIVQSGGEISLGDLHDFSERRYLVGHQKFSQMMEELVEEELVLYSYEDRMISLGEKALT